VAALFSFFCGRKKGKKRGGRKNLDLERKKTQRWVPHRQKERGRRKGHLSPWEKEGEGEEDDLCFSIRSKGRGGRGSSFCGSRGGEKKARGALKPDLEALFGGGGKGGDKGFLFFDRRTRKESSEGTRFLSYCPLCEREKKGSLLFSLLSERGEGKEFQRKTRLSFPFRAD